LVSFTYARNSSTQFFVFLRIFEEIDKFSDFHLGFCESSDIFEGCFDVRLFGNFLGLRFPNRKEVLFWRNLLMLLMASCFKLLRKEKRLTFVAGPITLREMKTRTAMLARIGTLPKKSFLKEERVNFSETSRLILRILHRQICKILFVSDGNEVEDIDSEFSLGLFELPFKS